MDGETTGPAGEMLPEVPQEVRDWAKAAPEDKGNAFNELVRFVDALAEAVTGGATDERIAGLEARLRGVKELAEGSSSPDHKLSKTPFGTMFENRESEEAVTPTGEGEMSKYVKVTTLGASGTCHVTTCDDDGSTSDGQEYENVEVAENITTAVNDLGILVKEKDGKYLFYPGLVSGTVKGQILIWNQTDGKWEIFAPPGVDGKTYALTMTDRVATWEEVKAFECPE